MSEQRIVAGFPCKGKFGGGLTIFLAIIVLLFAACQNDNEENGETVQLVNVGDEVPDFVLSGHNEEIVSSSLIGKAYILNFFDTRCPDCQKGLQVLQRIHDKYLETMPIFNVPRSQTRDEVQTYWDQAGLTMPFYTPGNKDMYYQFATRTIPRTYVIDSRGKVYAAFDDSPVADFLTLDAIVQQLQQDDRTVTLSLRVKVLGSNNNDDEYYFHNEYTISKLDIYYFDAATKKLSGMAEALSLTKEETPPDYQYDITYIHKNLRLSAGIYDIFAIANYDNAPSFVANEDELINMVDSISYYNGILANIPNNGPVMTNRATSLTNIDLTPWINKSYVLEINLERVMAKLQIGVAKDVFTLKHGDRKYADINITNYKLVNMNRQYYLFQHKDSLTELGEQPVFTMPDHFSDYNDEGEQYVVDPFFYKKKPNAVDAATFKDRYLQWYGTATTANFASMPSADNYGYAYMLENTSFKTSQKNAYSPGIIFKAAVSPVFVYLFDNTRRVLEEEYRAEYWPGTIYLYNHNFYGSIQALNVASGLTLDELVTYTDAELRDYGIKQCKFNMGVYETYYTYWIHHRNNTEGNMGAMEYGIVRNNYYRIIVTDINDIGTSTIIPEIMNDNTTTNANSFSRKEIRICRQPQ